MGDNVMSVGAIIGADRFLLVVASCAARRTGSVSCRVHVYPAALAAGCMFTRQLTLPVRRAAQASCRAEGHYLFISCPLMVPSDVRSQTSSRMLPLDENA
jgi:hypothetical protein